LAAGRPDYAPCYRNLDDITTVPLYYKGAAPKGGKMNSTTDEPALDRVCRLWRQTHNLYDSPFAVALEDASWTKPPAMLREPRFGLGPVPRLLIIERLMGLKSGADFYRWLARRGEVKIFPAPKQIERILRPQARFGFSPAIWEPDAGTRIAQWLDLKFPLQSGLKRNPADIFRHQFDGANACETYAAWLKSGSLVKDVYLPQPMTYTFLMQSKARQGAFDKLRQMTYGNTPSTSLVINVHCVNMWHGLTACAKELAARKPAGDSRAVLYIPLHAQGKTYDAPSFLRILGYLRAFFSGEDVAASAPIKPEENVHEVLLGIRQRMATDPAIIMLDGYTDLSVGLGDLERAILDDHLVFLVRRLVDPPIGHCDQPAQLSTFLRNRVIIFSDLALSPSVLPCNALEIPPPEDGKEALDAIELQPLRHRDHIVEVAKTDPGLRNPRAGCTPYVVDALISFEIAAGAPLPVDLYRLVAKNRGSGGGAAQELAYHSAIKTLLDRMEEERPDLFWILILIASTPGGIQLSTLESLVELAAQCVSDDNQPIELLPPIADVSKSLADLMAICGSFLTDGRSDDFDGLREDQARAWQTGTAKRRERDPQSNRGPCAIDFQYPEVRASILLRVDMELFPRVQALHRLLAEEALGQQTFALRHGCDLSSARSFRRLLAVLYHGFMSLPITKEGKLSRASLVCGAFAMPLDPRDAWEWLYLFAYRRLIEYPPNWNLSRFYGLDPLKLDILKLAAAPWEAWKRYPRLGMAISWKVRSLLPESTSDPRLGRISTDYHISQAHAAFSAGDLAQAHEAIERAEAVDAAIPKPWLTYAKRKFDLALLTQNRKEIARIESHTREMLGPPVQALDAYIADIARRIEQLVSQRNFHPVERLPPASPTIAALKEAGRSADWDGSSLMQVSDILFRLGERFALDGDLRHSAQKLAPIVPGQAPRTRIVNDDEAAIVNFCKAFAYFRLAENTRLQVFSDDPTGQHFYASGHSARQMARASLKLERLARGRAVEEGKIDDPASLGVGFFGQNARHMADVIARHLFRYPRERASMLILESQMSRLLSPPSQAPRGLEDARRFLRNAEPVVWSLGSTSRVRMRFLLERVKVHRRLARDADKRIALMYLEFCDSDLASLTFLVNHHQNRLWRDLTAIQIATVAEVRAQLHL
jgi:hypothetical protein